MHRLLEEIDCSAYTWRDTLALTTELTGASADNDLERELAFYKQALGAAHGARAQCKKAKIPFMRPSDYYAEMIKSDVQMHRVRTKLLEEEKGIKASEDARKMREAKKFGKKVQVEKQLERQKKKTQELAKISQLRKKRGKQEDDDDFDVRVEEAVSERPSKKQKTGKPTKKQTKDKKFGFGGKKRFAKSNTAESTLNSEKPPGRGPNRKARGASGGGSAKSAKHKHGVHPPKTRRANKHNKK